MVIVVTVLPHGLREINSAAVDTHRSAGLHPVSSKSKTLQLFGQSVGGRLRNTSARRLHLAHMHQSVEECAGSQNHRFGLEFDAEGCLHSAHGAVAVSRDRSDRVLPHVQVGGILKTFAPVERELHPVGLRARAPHGRPLRPVQHPELDRTDIGDNAHHAAESIYLPDNLTFGNSAHGRITAHLSYLVHIMGDKKRITSETCGSRCGLASGMARTNHNYIVIKYHRLFSYAFNRARASFSARSIISRSPGPLSLMPQR